MAGLRRRLAPPPPAGVRTLLAERIRARCSDFREPLSGHLYVHPGTRWLASLDAGRPVDVWPWLLRGIADVPPGTRLVRVDVDGGVSVAPYSRTAAPGGDTPSRA